MTTDKRTILLADDDGDERESFKLLLKSCGYKVLDADSPEKALQVLDASKDEIGILVTDYNMKNEMDGIGLINAVRTRGLDIPAILVSGQMDESMKARLKLAKGNNTALSKPVEADLLVKTIENKMGHSTAAVR